MERVPNCQLQVYMAPDVASRSKYILMVKTLVPLETVGGSSLRYQLLFPVVPNPQQKPAGAVKKCSYNSQAGRNGITLNVPWTLLSWIELGRDEIGEISNRAGERHAKGTFVIWRQSASCPRDGEGGNRIYSWLPFD